jgi:hypothetical protein
VTSEQKQFRKDISLQSEQRCHIHRCRGCRDCGDNGGTFQRWRPSVFAVRIPIARPSSSPPSVPAASEQIGLLGMASV